MKKFPAFIAAFFVTGILGVGMFGIGANALLYKNTVPVVNSPTSSATTSNVSAQSSTQSQIQQLQQVVNQYQARDQQYQSQMNQLVQELNQENTQLQAYQQLLIQLQQAGVIIIRQDGTILLPRTR